MIWALKVRADLLISNRLFSSRYDVLRGMSIDIVVVQQGILIPTQNQVVLSILF